MKLNNFTKFSSAQPWREIQPTMIKLTVIDCRSALVLRSISTLGIPQNIFLMRLRVTARRDEFVLTMLSFIRTVEHFSKLHINTTDITEIITHSITHFPILHTLWYFLSASNTVIVAKYSRTETPIGQQARVQFFSNDLFVFRKQLTATVR